MTGFTARNIERTVSPERTYSPRQELYRRRRKRLLKRQAKYLATIETQTEEKSR